MAHGKRPAKIARLVTQKQRIAGIVNSEKPVEQKAEALRSIGVAVRRNRTHAVSPDPKRS